MTLNNIRYIGLSEQDGVPKLENLRIFGVLQRLATCYFFTAIIVLVFDKKYNQRDTTRLPICKKYLFFFVL